MSRPLRQFSKSQTYHIILKGIDNQDIFYDNQDRNFFKGELIETKSQFEYQIYAYCLMSNHVHLVMRIKDELLSKAMQSLSIRYVKYFNKKYERVGTFIQSRFYSKNIEDKRYFLTVCKYIHRNPENAGIARTKDYEWSSYKEYIEKESIIDKEVLLHYFNNSVEEFIKYTTLNSLGKSRYNEIEDFAEYEMIQKLTDTDVSKLIMKRFNLKSISEVPLFFKNKDAGQLRDCIGELKKIKGVNKTQISRIIRMTRRQIEKYW